MAPPLVYIIILNWNLKHDTAECIDSALKMDFPNYRIAVVDNNSTDGSPEFLKAKFPNINVIVNSENMGYAAGSNVGIRYALQREADYILLLNNDTIVDQRLLSQLVEAGETDPKAGILGPMILYYDQRDRIWHMGARRRGPMPVPLKEGSGARDSGQYVSPLELDMVSGCCMLVKRAVFERLGFLDPGYFMYYEDADFCQRAQEEGYRVLCVPTAKIWHKVSRSTIGNLARFRYYQARSRALYYRRYRYGPHPLLTALVVAISTMRTMALDILHGGVKAAWASAAGLYRGWSDHQRVGKSGEEDGIR